MKSRKIIIVFINVLFVISLCCCVLEEVILFGDISGYVTDAETSEPLDSALIELNQSNDTIDIDTTLSDGSYLISSIAPGNYEIQVSKPTYGIVTKDVEVESAYTTEINFNISKVPYPEISVTYLDFGTELTSNSFTISNIGTGNLSYSLNANQDWITVNPIAGEATDETDTIEVTIDKSGLTEQKQMEFISIISYSAGDIIQDTVDVLVNGVRDMDGNYYGVVTIGTQTWMAESLNTGTKIDHIDAFINPETMNNDLIEKFCYDNLESNCDKYGGLYTWHEALDYPPQYPPEITWIHQGVCPVGWHIPLRSDMITLEAYLDPPSGGGKLKDTGTVEDGTGLWKAPNTGATNEYGFTALPGGVILWPDYLFELKDEQFYMWSTSQFDSGEGIASNSWRLQYNNSGFGVYWIYPNEALSVRCIKDPE